MIVEKKPERSYSTTVMYILAYLDRYGYPVLILIAGALADFYRGRITMLFVLAVGILLDGIYNLVGYLCRWRHIYLCYQSMCHTKMTPSRIEWDRMTKRCVRHSCYFHYWRNHRNIGEYFSQVKRL